MQVIQSGSIKYNRFSSFDLPGLYHAVFTRQGGTSPAPWKSLNFGSSVGDDKSLVQRNKEKAFTTTGIDLKSVYDVYQVHSSEVVRATRPLNTGEVHLRADAMITNQPGVTLLMRFADCVPILFYDPKNRAVGLAHAGWIGTVNKIANKVIRKMEICFGSKTTDLLAAIGPSIGPDHYQIQSDVAKKVVSSYKNDAAKVLINHDGKIYLDLWLANDISLREAGVGKIEIAGLCTQCHMDDWYSHRGEHGKTGRFGIMLGLEAGE
ncbi:MAG: peptidoglycan editing factor PgeF [Anaerolineae bacterium]|nr:peptidoglycan editing factor PgeF [Anaerolineae bacterium]